MSGDPTRGSAYKIGSNRGIARRHRERKHEEALERAQARAKRTTEEQIALLDSRPGNSVKERKRLSA